MLLMFRIANNSDSDYFHSLACVFTSIHSNDCSVFVFHIKFVFTFLHTEMENLTARICWELVKKEGYIAIWKKPLNNSCYINRDAEVQPPLCDNDDDPDNVWYLRYFSPLFFKINV